MEFLKSNQREILALLAAVLQNTLAPQPSHTSDDFDFPMQTTSDVGALNLALADKATYAKLVNS